MLVPREWGDLPINIFKAPQVMFCFYLNEKFEVAFFNACDSFKRGAENTSMPSLVA